MKVLFLDVDGVLNSKAWYEKKRASGESIVVGEIDPDAVLCIHRIVEQTGAMIVLSSSWRGGTWHEAKLRDAGIVFAHTTGPMAPDGNRGAEIATWLSLFPEVSTYAIVDDDDDAGTYAPERFVQTDWQIGITEREEAALIALLNE